MSQALHHALLFGKSKECLDSHYVRLLKHYIWHKSDHYYYNPEKTARPNWYWSSVAAGAIQALWVGHASLLVQMGGVTFLTDPVLSERCSAVQVPTVPYTLPLQYVLSV